MNIIYNILTMLLGGIFEITGDWGITVIALTLVVKLVLLPISLKQKSAMEKQQKLSKEMEEIKQKYKNEKSKLDEEIMRLSKEGSKSMLGCLGTILQLPVLYSLYSTFIKMPMETASIIIPWVSSISLPDPYFVIPLITVAAQLLPSILSTVGFLKTAYIPKLTLSQVVLMGSLGLLFLIKAPAALGVYWITSSIFTAAEQIGYSIYKARTA